MPIGLVSESDFFAELSSYGSSVKEPVEDSEEARVHTPVSPSNSDSEESDFTQEKQGTAASTDLSFDTLDEDTSDKDLVVLGELIPNIIDIPKRGRKSGDVNVPDSLRQVIASTALMDGREAALQLAADFGISPSSVSAYTNGATSTTSYTDPKPSIVSHLNKTKERAIKAASKTMSAAIKAISQEKLDYTDAPDLARIAKDMSAIIKNLEPQEVADPTGNSKAPQFVIFAPQFRDERSFETIHVTE